MSEHVLRSRAHDFLVWALSTTARWPKRMRYGFTGALEGHLVGIVSDLAEAEARRGEARVEALRRADGRLAAARALLRVAVDLGVLSSGAYEQAAERAAEIGRLLGGWLSSCAVSPGHSRSVRSAPPPADRSAGEPCGEDARPGRASHGGEPTDRAAAG